MSAWAIIVAAGTGTRFGGEGPKAFETLARKPMVAHALRAFAEVSEIDGIVLVVPPDLVTAAPSHLATTMPSKEVRIVGGGASRQGSVRRGLDTVPASVERIVVHDAARPLVTSALVRAALDALGDAAGAVVAVPQRDTLKHVASGRVEGTVPRDGLWRAQTPQAFHAAVLRAAHERADAEGIEATDDAMLVERMGERVVVVPGDERNIKITTRDDLAIAEALLAERERV